MGFSNWIETKVFTYNTLRYVNLVSFRYVKYSYIIKLNV